MARFPRWRRSDVGWLTQAKKNNLMAFCAAEKQQKLHQPLFFFSIHAAKETTGRATSENKSVNYGTSLHSKRTPCFLQRCSLRETKERASERLTDVTLNYPTFCTPPNGNIQEMVVLLLYTDIRYVNTRTSSYNTIDPLVSKRTISTELSYMA